MATSNLDKYVRGRLPDLPESKEKYLQEELRKLEKQAATAYDKVIITEQSVEGLSAEIALERTVRANETESLAQQIETITASGARQSVFRQTSAPSTAVSGDLWIDSDDDNKLYYYQSGTGWVATDNAQIASNAAAITSEATARANADSSLASQITTVSATASRQRIYRQGTAPSSPAVGDLWIDTSDNNKYKYWSGSAWTASDDLRIAVNEAAITNEATARANADSSLATQINTLSASTTTGLTNVNARITTEETTRANADTALSTSISNVSAVANAKVKTYYQTSAPTGTLVTGDMWFDSDDNNKAYRYDGTAWVAVDDARIAVNAANISTETTARANADSALATQITNLSTTVGNQTTSISTLSSSIDGVKGRYGVTINNNGHISGISLLSDSTNGNPTSIFRIAANQFAVRTPGASTDSIYWDSATSKLIVRGDIEATSVTTSAVTQAGLATNAVSTPKIEANAVTLPVAAYTAGSTTSPTAQSASITSSGGPISINAGFVYVPSSFSGTLSVSIRHNGTTIFSFSTLVLYYDEFGNPGMTITVPPILHTPAAGTNNYELVVSGPSGSVRNRGLVLLELKR